MWLRSRGQKQITLKCERQERRPHPCRVQGQRCSCSCVIGGLMETPPAGDGHGWLFSSPCFLRGPGCDAGREGTCWSLTALMSGSPGFPRRSQTGFLNTGWCAQSQTAPGNNRPACCCKFSKQTACHKLILNVVLSLCNHQLLWVANLINGFLVLFR